MAARGHVNGRGPLRRSGRDLVFRCYPPELLSKKKQKLTFGSASVNYYTNNILVLELCTKIFSIQTSDV